MASIQAPTQEYMWDDQNGMVEVWWAYFNQISGSPTFNGINNTAGAIQNTTRVTATYTILSTDENIFGDTDGGGFTATLPAGIDGTHYKIMNSGTSGNTLDVAPNGTELLIGINSSFTLNDGESLDLVYETIEGWA